MSTIVSRCHRSLRARAVLALAALSALAALLAPAAQAAPGDLDPAFGNGGSVRLFASNEDISLQAVAVQPDGKVVLTGGDRTTNSWITVRLSADGTLDPSFGSGGVVSLPFPAGGFGVGRAVAVQPDGKIVVAGEAKGAVDGDIAVLRYESDGAPDPTFGGGDGIEIVPAPLTEERAEAVAIGAGGRILATGEIRSTDPKVGGVSAFAMVLRPDGELDGSFNNNGFKVIQTTGAEKSDRGGGIAESPDGKIVVSDETGNGAGNGFTVVRLLADGGLDPKFGAGTGIVNTPIPGGGSAEGRSVAVAVQPDGRIVAAGYGFDMTGPKNETRDTKFAAIRYLGDGKLDTAFGGAGTGIFSRQVGEGDDAAQTVSLTASGRIFLAGGYSPATNDRSVAAMRLDPSGLLDPSFGADGIVRRGPQAPFGDSFEGAALDSRERVVIASEDFVGGGNTEIEVSRFLGDIPPDPPAAPLGAGGGTSSPPKPAPEQKPQPPHARMKAVPRKLEAAKLTGFAGTAAAPVGASILKVQIAVVRAAAGKGGKAATCLQMVSAQGRFKTVGAEPGKCPLRWLDAKGTTRWSFALKTVLPGGRYVVYSRAVSSSGLAESAFSRGAGNRYGFRLLEPQVDPFSVR
jgi:uncharacterized delta-60 repeat protein